MTLDITKIRYYDTEEIKKRNEGKGFLDIKDYADENCKKCYGTGKTGFLYIKEKKTFIPCKCVIKNIHNINNEEMKQNALQKNREDSL